MESEAISKGTMMGFPCLRTHGDFFASMEPSTGHLVVKLASGRVQQMIADGEGYEFKPSGKRFKEWVTVTDRDEQKWEDLLVESVNFVDRSKGR
ncbi:MAG: hypothetical protein ACI80V_003703 [Rhodothermales bacterium]|jgi:hypothetical protein